MVAASATIIRPDTPHTTRIVLEEHPNIPPTGQYFGHNGKGYLIRAGEEVDVPDCIIGILDDALEGTVVMDGQKKILGPGKDRRRFAYRVVRT